MDASLESLRRRVTALERTVSAMQKSFLAQEQSAMNMADTASDVVSMRKELDSHRYDLRLLKANVGELISADRAYALELDQARSRLENCMAQAATAASLAAPPAASRSDHEGLMREIMEAMQSRMEEIVEAKVNAIIGRNHRARISSAEEERQDKLQQASTAQELNHHYANGTVFPLRNQFTERIDPRIEKQCIPNMDDERELLELRREFLKSQLVTERAQGIQNQEIQNATRDFESDLARLEKAVIHARSNF